MVIIEDDGHFAIIRDGNGFRVVTAILHHRLGTRLIRGPNRGTPPDLDGYRATREEAVKLMEAWTHYLTKKVVSSRLSKRLEHITEEYEQMMENK